MIALMLFGGGGSSSGGSGLQIYFRTDLSEEKKADASPALSGQEIAEVTNLGDENRPMAFGPGVRPTADDSLQPEARFVDLGASDEGVIAINDLPNIRYVALVLRREPLDGSTQETILSRTNFTLKG